MWPMDTEITPSPATPTQSQHHPSFGMISLLALDKGVGQNKDKKTINKNSAAQVLKFHSCSSTAPNFN